MTTATLATTRTFDIDKAHSEALFQVRHLLSKVRGRFSDFEGVIEFDDANPENSKVEFTIQTKSIDTNQPDRDAHLRSADFFSADEFPTLTFRSTKITPRGGNTYDVTGELTLRGVTRTVVIPVDYLGKAKDPWGNEKLGFEGEVTLNRKEYGLNWNAALETGGFLVGDEVRVTVSVQAAPRS
jgi:polyisoprenoid-binding protein YceI